MRMATRWFWVRGRMVWCMQGGTWATKCASPSRKSLRRTARMRKQHSFFHSDTLLHSFSWDWFFHDSLNGKGFGRGEAHWLSLDPQCSSGTACCLHFLCFVTLQYNLHKQFRLVLCNMRIPLTKMWPCQTIFTTHCILLCSKKRGINVRNKSVVIIQTVRSLSNSPWQFHIKCKPELLHSLYQLIYILTLEWSCSL